MVGRLARRHAPPGGRRLEAPPSTAAALDSSGWSGSNRTATADAVSPDHPGIE